MKAVLALIIANIIWGAAAPIFKYAISDIPPFTLAFIRFFGGGLLFLPFIRQFKPIKGSYLFNIILGGIFGIALHISLFFMGLQLAPSINVQVISAMGAIILYFLSIAILKEKPHPQIVKGMMISLLGVLIIIFAPFFTAEIQHTSTSSASLEILGNVFFALAVLGGVFLAIFNKKVVNKVDTVTVTAIQFFIGSFAFFPFMMNELQTWSFASLTTAGWFGIIYGTIFSSAIAYFLHNYSLRKIPVQEFGVMGYISPVVAVVVAIPLLQEYPDIFFIVGTAFVFIGMFISERHPHMKKLHNKLQDKK